MLRLLVNGDGRRAGAPISLIRSAPSAPQGDPYGNPGRGNCSRRLPAVHVHSADYSGRLYLQPVYVRRRRAAAVPLRHAIVISTGVGRSGQRVAARSPALDRVRPRRGQRLRRHEPVAGRRAGGAGRARDDSVGPAMEAEQMFGATAITPQTAPTLRRLAGLRPRTFATIHGSSFSGDGDGALRSLAAYYESQLKRPDPA